MPRLASWMFGAITAATVSPGCGPSSTTISPRPSPAPATIAQRLRFAWPVPGAATVTDTVQRTGRAGKTRLRIRLARLEPGDQLMLSFDELVVTEIDGVSVQEQHHSGGLLPGLLLSAEGKVSDTTNLTSIREQSIELVGRGQNDAERSIRALLESPFALARVQQGVHRYWRHWVELWEDLPVPDQPGQPHAFDVRRVDADGVERGYRISVELEHRDVRDAIELWQVQTMDPADAAQLIRVRTMESLSVVAVPANEPTVDAASITVSAGAHLDRTTLRPRWVDVTTNVRARLNGLPTDTTEHHRYEFSWDG